MKKVHIIVGFSGETTEQFEETLTLYHEVGFDISYNAQYSPRSGTLAAKLFPDDVPAQEKRRRWDEIQERMKELALQKNQAYVGQEMLMLVERVEEGLATGTNRELKVCRFPSQDTTLIGKLLPVRAKLAKSWIFEVEPLDKKSHALGRG